MSPSTTQPAAPVVLGEHPLHLGLALEIATSAASWATVGADMIVYWWIFRIPSRIPAGAHIQPMRQPVIAYAFEKPPMRIVRSRIPGSAENARWRYVPYARRS